VFKAGVNVQNRVGYYRLNSVTLSTGYNWAETAAKTHELYPLDVSYVRTDQKSAAFDEEVKKNPVLEKSLEDQFIVGTRYSYTVNTQLSEAPARKYEERKYRTHNFYFNGNVDLAGNLINLIQERSRGAGEDPTLFGFPFSPYVKGDIDLRHYLTFDQRNKIASRIILGAGYAYEGTTTLPYVKQFSIGGSNSLRAFPARSVGPGTYYIRENIPPDSTQFIDQRGDIKLEANTEYRFDIYKIVKGAIFLDAGNIWLLKQDTTETRPGVMFDPKKFLNQLAVGTGFGLRFDFSFFVLRLDMAFPLRKPWLEEDPWVIDDIDFGTKKWRKENLIFNIAIGYPF
jgi:outer membrane protein assembly factor BamA